MRTLLAALVAGAVIGTGAASAEAAPLPGFAHRDIPVGCYGISSGVWCYNNVIGRQVLVTWPNPLHVKIQRVRGRVNAHPNKRTNGTWVWLTDPYPVRCTIGRRAVVCRAGTVSIVLGAADLYTDR